MRLTVHTLRLKPRTPWRTRFARVTSRVYPIGWPWGAARVESDDDDQPLAARLARLWSAQDRGAFFALVLGEVMPRFCRSACAGLRLQETDAEDCMAEALESFIERPESISVTSVEALSPSASSDAVDQMLQTSALVPEQWAVVAVEESLGEVEADASWATIVIDQALIRLTPAQRDLIRHLAAQPFDLSRNDFDIRSKEAAEVLGMRPDAFRKAKQRAYEALRQAIPEVVRELGLKPPPRFAGAFAESRGAFLAEGPPEEEN